MNFFRYPTTVPWLVLGLSACSSMTPPSPPAPLAAAHLSARSNTKVSGTVTFKQVGDRVLVWPAHVDPTVAYHEAMHLADGPGHEAVG